MLSLVGGPISLCDGLSRRSFLTIGGLAMGGLGLAQVLKADAANQLGHSHKSVIMIFLSGGPPHQDMVDLKPDAPREYRGEFQPISTNVSGVHLCEHLPLLARRTDRLNIIRTLVGSEGRHAAFQCLHGHTVQNQPQGGWPCFGSAISKLCGPVNNEIPPAVALQPKLGIPTWADVGQAGFAGMAHLPFAPNATGTHSLTLDQTSAAKLGYRRALLDQIEGFRTELTANAAIDGMSDYYQQAFDILSSGKLATALDFELEPEETRERYGRGNTEPAGYGDAGWLRNEDLLVARRLIEAGARVVTLSFGRWDWHGQPHGTNFDNARDHLPRLDQALTALLDDLEERSMLDDVTVLVWGEFGRTPLINPRGGRDHWPQVGCALMAGGGMRTGQVIGATNERAEYPVERPVHFQEVFATLYHNMGFDVDLTTIPERGGRPMYLVDHSNYQPLPEVI